MKLNSATMLNKSGMAIRVLAISIACIAFFFVGIHWSSSSSSSPSSSPFPFFFSSSTSISSSPSSIYVSISPNANKTFDPPSPPPPPPSPERFGVVDENGTMSDDFVVAGDDRRPDLDASSATRNESTSEGKEGEVGVRVRVGKFERCPESMKEYIPCLDNEEAIARLESTERGEKYERNCPPQGKGLDCLIPPPKDYKIPIPWPQSRDEVWYSNVPHTRLVDDKGGQNWISRDGDKFRFPGGGTQFIHGAKQYLNQIEEMVPDISFGRYTRVVLDVGCGVASFGAFALSQNVTTLSIAPKDVHENQIQFALERGVPAMIAAFATHRLLYPSQAFELIHCSRCRINWTRDDGMLLLEVNRMIRAGGYFAWAAQPVYKHEEAQQEAWIEMENLTSRMCWELVKKEGYIAIWRKPLNNSCYMNREAGVTPLLCDEHDDPDQVWYADLKPCISRIPENGYGANITTWPERLYSPPDRLQDVSMDAYVSKKELFEAESRYWHEVIQSYIKSFHWREIKLRNVMDMRASFGGFAAALVDLNVGCWVMNVVPTSGPNTLPVIYDRGLIGVAHDWCEPFDTYPRTYDLLHAANLFSKEQKRCNMTSILLEMDRILRPGGRAYIRDTITVTENVKTIAEAMGWKAVVRETQEGPFANTRLLMCDK